MVKVRADLHNHLRTSGRSYEPDFNRAIDIASQRLGPGAVIGLVNFADRRYEHFTDLRGYGRFPVGEKSNAIYVPQQQVLVVKGQEVPTKQGHVLVLGLGRDVHLKQNRSLTDTIKEAIDNDATIVADHPFYAHGIGSYLEANPDILKDLDAIEVHNAIASFRIPFLSSPFPHGANRKAQAFYDRKKINYQHLGALATSDGHSMHELGKSWTEIDEPSKDPKEFCRSLRDSIRNTNTPTPKRKTEAIISAMEHLLDLALITQIGFRIGLRNYYCGKDRPQD